MRIRACPAGARRRRRCSATRPSRRSSSCRCRAAAAFQLRTTGVPATSLAELVPARAPRTTTSSTWPRCPSATSWGTSPACSHRQFSVDLGAYPLGSCTMKYNPKFCDAVAADPGLNSVHPGAPAALDPGLARAARRRSRRGSARSPAWRAATLQPAAGAAGELTGLLLMRAYHEADGEHAHAGSSSPTRPTARIRPRSPSAATR